MSLRKLLPLVLITTLSSATFAGFESDVFFQSRRMKRLVEDVLGEDRLDEILEGAQKKSLFERLPFRNLKKGQIAKARKALQADLQAIQDREQDPTGSYVPRELRPNRLRDSFLSIESPSVLDTVVPGRADYNESETALIASVEKLFGKETANRIYASASDLSRTSALRRLAGLPLALFKIEIAPTKEEDYTMRRRINTLVRRGAHRYIRRQFEALLAKNNLTVPAELEFLFESDTIESPSETWTSQENNEVPVASENTDTQELFGMGD